MNIFLSLSAFNTHQCDGGCMYDRLIEMDLRNKTKTKYKNKKDQGSNQRNGLELAESNPRPPDLLEAGHS